MAYIGRNPAIGTQKVLDSLESQFNGTLTTFDLRYNTNTIYPTIASALIVSLGGVLQEPGSAYNVASDQITFATAPPTGADCWILLYSEFGGQAGATTNLTVGNNLAVQGNTDLDGDIDIDAGQVTYTASSNIAKFADGAKLVFGDGDDLQIYHDGSNSYIDDTGTGQLYIRGSAQIHLENGLGTEKYARFERNGTVELYYDNSKKIETTSTGATVTGTALATSLSTGASGTGINISTDTISGPATLTIDPAAVGDNTGTVIIAGDLQVDGTTTTINSTTLTVDDKNIVLASGATNNVAADGAGITIDTANATLLYKATPDAWSFNKNVGIDTNNPQAKLDVNGLTKSGGFQATGNVTPTTGQGVEIFSPSSSQGMIQAFDRGGASQMELKLRGSDVTFFGTSNTDERLRITGAGLVRVPDNGKFTAGAGDDLQIYHDGTDSIIDNTNGDLYLKTTGSGDDIIIRAADDVIIQTQGSEGAVIARGDGTVELYYDNSKKFETTTTGAKVTGALEVTQEYPTIRPTLDLNFAATKTLDRRITFTRDSLGTYTDELGIIRYASNNVPRFDHDPTTGESLGLLIEESRTNYTYNSIVSNAPSLWHSSRGSFTNITTITSPGGTTDGLVLFTEDTQTGPHHAKTPTNTPTKTIADATTVTSSVWLKKYGSKQYVLFGINTKNDSYERTTVDLDTGAISNTAANYTATSTAYPDGWYRITVTGDGGTGSTRTAPVNSLFLIQNGSSSTSSYTGDGSSGVYIWGPQMEIGSFATSFIPTRDANTVTRAQDTAKITGTNFTDFYNQEEGTLVAHYYSTVDDNYIATFENVTTPGDDRIGLVNYAGYQGFVETGNSGQASLDNGTPTVGAVNKVAFAFKVNDFAVSLNSATPVTDTSGTIPTVGRMMIGSRQGGTYDALKSTLRHLSYYPKRLPNAQLQGLTQQ